MAKRLSQDIKNKASKSRKTAKRRAAKHEMKNAIRAIKAKRKQK